MSPQGQQYLGFDLGASGGRAVVGTLRGRKLVLREIHRFPNGPVSLPYGPSVERGQVSFSNSEKEASPLSTSPLSTLYWDVLALWGHMQQTLVKCAAAKVDVSCVGVDAWGADFGLIDRRGTLLGNPVCYRDARTAGSEKLIARRIDPDRVYGIAGQAPHRIHNLAQLFVMSRDPGGRDMLRQAQCFLPVPDLMRFFLCGHRAAEPTTAGSCQMFDLARRRWSRQIVRACGIPERILPPVVQPGTIVGQLRPELAEMAELSKVHVAAVAGHDTASAVAALPCVDDDCVFLSLGTWGIFGVMSGKPVRAAGAREKGFINQMGLDGVFFNKNLAGLHLFETLRRDYAQQGAELTYEQILREAAAAKPFPGLLNINGPLMTYTVAGVTKAVGRFLRATGQRAALTRGEMFRLLLEALAFSYRQAVEDLSALTGQNFRRMCAVGGGTRNGLLCRFIADATGLDVMAGPVEGAVMGNLAVQALARGRLESAGDVRELVRNSSEIETYKPTGPEAWRRQYDRYLDLAERTKELSE